MVKVPASATYPIAFSMGGTQYQIPAKYIVFEDGTLKVDGWPPYNNTLKAIVDPFLDRLKTAGVLVASLASPPRPAFEAKAKTPGSTGVEITIEISAVTPNSGNPPVSTATVKVTETNTYKKLPLAKLVETIGNVANGGTRPGLVFVSSAGAPAMPDAAGAPYELGMTAPNPGDPATAKVLDGGTPQATAFTLTTRAGGADAPNVKIKIDEVDTINNTFTLIATWTKSKVGAVMSGLANDFDFVLVITAPSGGFLAPMEGKTTLSGGQDAVSTPTAKASAVVFANG